MPDYKVLLLLLPFEVVVVHLPFSSFIFFLFFFTTLGLRIKGCG